MTVAFNTLATALIYTLYSTGKSIVVKAILFLIKTEYFAVLLHMSYCQLKFTDRNYSSCRNL